MSYSAPLPKFRRGDIAEHKSARCIIVRRLAPDNDSNRYEIIYIQSKISETVYEDDLKFYTSDLKFNAPSQDLGEKCPRCNTPWAISGFGASKWKDCLKCKKKAEDILGNSSSWKEDDYSQLELEDLMGRIYKS